MTLLFYIQVRESPTDVVTFLRHPHPPSYRPEAAAFVYCLILIMVNKHRDLNNTPCQGGKDSLSKDNDSLDK